MFTSFTFCNITSSCSLILKENIRCSITCVSLIECLLRLLVLAGLTCYLNSVLQSLFGVPDFLHDLLKLQQKIQALPQDSSIKPTGLLGPFCRLAFVKNKGQQDDIASALHHLRAALVKSSPQVLKANCFLDFSKGPFINAIVPLNIKYFMESLQSY